MNAEVIETANSTAIVEYSETEAALAKLREQYKGVLFDVTTTKGDKEARSARKSLVTLRTALDKKRLELNAKDRARIEGRNSEAGRITDEIVELEEPIDEQIKAEETRKENDRQAAIEAELKRIAEIDARIEAIRGWPVHYAGKPSALIRHAVKTADNYIIDESFAEKSELAQSVLEASRVSLSGILTQREAHEAEQERIKLEREELGRLRAEAAEREAKERARLAEEERQAKVARDAEAARHAAQFRQQAEDAAREQRERQAIIDAENERRRIAQEAEAKVERDRLAAERAELERKEREAAETQRVEEARQAAARAEIERQQEALRKSQAPAPIPAAAPLTRSGVAVLRPSAHEIVRVLAVHYRAHPDTILDWIRDTDWNDEAAAA